MARGKWGVHPEREIHKHFQNKCKCKIRETTQASKGSNVEIITSPTEPLSYKSTSATETEPNIKRSLTGRERLRLPHRWRQRRLQRTGRDHRVLQLRHRPRRVRKTRLKESTAEPMPTPTEKSQLPPKRGDCCPSTDRWQDRGRRKCRLRRSKT